MEPICVDKKYVDILVLDQSEYSETLLTSVHA